MKCSAMVLGNASAFKGADGHPCKRNAVRDGLCGQHHPDSMAKREAAAVAAHAAYKARMHVECNEKLERVEKLLRNLIGCLIKDADHYEELKAARKYFRP